MKNLFLKFDQLLLSRSFSSDTMKWSLQDTKSIRIEKKLTRPKNWRCRNCFNKKLINNNFSTSVKEVLYITFHCEYKYFILAHLLHGPCPSAVDQIRMNCYKWVIRWSYTTVVLIANSSKIMGAKPILMKFNPFTSGIHNVLKNTYNNMFSLLWYQSVQSFI